MAICILLLAIGLLSAFLSGRASRKDTQAAYIFILVGILAITAGVSKMRELNTLNHAHSENMDGTPG